MMQHTLSQKGFSNVVEAIKSLINGTWGSMVTLNRVASHFMAHVFENHLQ
jgi:hypothetical protein